MNDAELEADPVYKALKKSLLQAVDAEPLCELPADRFQRGLTRWHESLIGLAFLAANRVAADMVLDNDQMGSA